MKATARTTHNRTRRLRSLLLAVAAIAVLTSPAVTAAAQPPEHGHVLLVGVEVVPGSFPPVPSSVRNCVDLAAGQQLPLHAHHAHMHLGQVNEVFAANTRNVVIPVAPFPDPFGPGEVPWSDCDSLLAFFGLD